MIYYETQYDRGQLHQLMVCGIICHLLTRRFLYLLLLPLPEPAEYHLRVKQVRAVDLMNLFSCDFSKMHLQYSTYTAPGF